MFPTHEQLGLNLWNELLAMRGSITHNTSLDDGLSDVDLIGIVVPSLPHYYGLLEYGSRGTMEIKDIPNHDVVLYEARKAFGMLAQSNPNMLEMLWLPEQFYLNVTNAGRFLLSYRTEFLSKRARNSISGHATSQLRRMAEGVTGTMGEKRKAVIARDGYDTRAAAHVIRLLSMGIHLMTTGEVRVGLPVGSGIHDTVMSIKRGEWPKARFETLAREMFDEFERATDASSLPDEPEWGTINTVCTRFVSIAFQERGQ